MKTSFLLCIFVSLALGAPAFAKPEDLPEVLVVADVLAEPPESVLPQPGKPVYYFILGKLERHLGDLVAGEKMPNPEDVQKILVDALAKQGFIQTQIGGPRPSAVLLFSWGSAVPSIFESTETNSETGESTTSSDMMNKRQMAALVGAGKASQQLLLSSEADALNDAMNNDRLYIFVAALDADALAKKQKKLLWRTRISIDARRQSLPERVGLMVDMAAPFFGKDHDMPEFVDPIDRKGKVSIGDTKVLETDVKLRPEAQKDKK
jgi:hypothetical protein